MIECLTYHIAAGTADDLALRLLLIQVACMPSYIVIFAVGGMAVSLLTFLIAFFHPGLAYRTTCTPSTPLDSREFTRLVALVSDSETHPDARLEVLTNGDCFYEAELAAIQDAKAFICLEAYIFQKGEIASRFIKAMVGRARAGVEVRIVLDAIGSLNTWNSTFRELLDAGGEVYWYNTFRWYNLPRINNRTHRELLIVDGAVGFIGGAGIADHWWKSRGPRHPRWRDTMFRVQGRAVAGLVSMFAQNWLESSGELLIAPDVL